MTETSNLGVIPVAKDLLIYYGTEMPNRELTRNLRRTTVVLQPYHALCQSGEFADYFPLARRFVYFNPTAARAELLAEQERTIPVLEHDPLWDLERIDLRRASARKFAIEQGQKALSFPGSDGLFVDDLDRWDQPDVRRHALTVLRAVAGARMEPPAWFLNRGFGFWRWPRALSAVLLEDLTPYRVDHMSPFEVSWLTTVALRPLYGLRDSGTAIYSVTYDPDALGWHPISAAARALATLAGEPILSTIHFDRWPHYLTEEN